MNDSEYRPKTPQRRTRLQNAAAHQYFKEVADLLNESGIPMEVFYRNIEADYTMESVKELFRSFARAKYGKGSTAELTTREVQEVYEEVNRHLSQFGMFIPFPSLERDINYEDEKYM